MENCYDDTGSSSHLPPLMDTFISFEQAPANHHPEGNEQVPCFSSFSQQPHRQTPPAAAPPPHHLLPPPPLGHMPMTARGLAQLGAIPDLGPYLTTPFNCEKKVIRAVLDQYLTKFDGIPKPPDHGPAAPHHPAEGSSESYLTETGGPSMWHPF